MNQLKSIDLFAGIGGIRLGFDRAFGKDIETVFVSEWDEYAQKTYKANFNDDFEIAGDITKISEADIPAFDICLAGFPCQAFSLAGHEKDLNNVIYSTCINKYEPYLKDITFDVKKGEDFTVYTV